MVVAIPNRRPCCAASRIAASPIPTTGTPPCDIHFDDVYAPGTHQNHPHEPGLFRFWLARRFDTHSYPDGAYRLDVEAADIRGNASRGHRVVTIANALDV